MKTKFTFLLSLTFLFLFSGSVYGGEWIDGLDAAQRQDYKTAHRLWLSSAEQGNANAQYELGVMHEKGEGVPLDYIEAVKWFRLSAEQGNAEAREVLDLISREIAQRKNQDNSQDSEGSRPKGKDDMWVAEQMESGGAFAYVNGQITHGDKQRIWLGDSRCNEGEQLFSFYTMEKNKEFLNLKGKVIEIKYNQEHIRAKIITAKKFLVGHIAMFTLGAYSIEQLLKVHKDSSYITIELIDSEQFKASEYFDILQNKWSLENFKPALIKAKSICEKSKVNDTGTVSKSNESNKTSSSQLLQQASEALNNKEYQKAFEILKPLADQGNSKAQFELGVMYEKGQGVPQDDKEAVKWYRLAAEQGFASAQFNLGVMYAKGQGVPQDDKEAVKWYRLAAEQGFASAQFNLGLMYHKGQGVPQDNKEAVRWWKLAAEQGFANAQYNLGYIYDNGEGVTQDYKEAVKWYRLAAEQGLANAQSNLGMRYHKGQGVPQDYKEAGRLYRLSAEQGNAQAQSNLGLMYYKGTGVLQDYALAHMWFNLSGSNGNKQAVKKRDIVEKRMSPSQIEKAQDMARNWKPKK
jgi:uncharacterized protein